MSKTVTDSSPEQETGHPTARWTLKRRILFAVSTGWGYRILAVAGNFLMTWLLFRYLDEEALGVWFLMVGAQLFSGLFDFGFGQTLQRRIAFCKGEGGASLDRETTPAIQDRVLSILAIGRLVYLVISLVVFLGLFLGGQVYFAGLGLSHDIQTMLEVGWFLMAAGYAANVWAWYVEAILNGLGDIGWSNLVSSVFLVLQIVFSWLVLYLGFGVGALAAVWTIKGLGTRMVGWLIIRFRHPWIGTRQGSFQWSEFQTMIWPAIQWWLAIVGYFFMTGISRYLLADISGTQEVPDYVATYTALVAIQGTLVTVVTVATPLFSQLIRAGDMPLMRHTIITLSRFGLAALTMIYCLLGVYARELFELWLGPGHFVGYPVFLVLAVTLTVEAHQGMLQSAAVAGEKLSWYKYNLVGGGLSLLAALCLIPRWNILGAALAIMLPQLVTQNWIIPYVSLRFMKLPLAILARRVLFPTVATGGVTVIVSICVKCVIPGFVPGLLACLGILTGLGYWVVRKTKFQAVWSLVRGQPRPAEPS